MNRFDPNFFGGTVCGSWLALGSVALLGVAGAASQRRGSGAFDLDKVLDRIAGDPPAGWTRGQVYGEIKRLLRQNKKLRVNLGRVGTGKHFEFALYGPDADLVAKSLERGGLRMGDGESVSLGRTLLSGDGSDLNPITLDFGLSRGSKAIEKTWSLYNQSTGQFVMGGFASRKATVTWAKSHGFDQFARAGKYGTNKIAGEVWAKRRKP